VHSFTDSDLSDTDSIVPFEYVFGGMLNLAQSISQFFENTTSINLINLLYVLLIALIILINRSGIFKRYGVVSVRQI